MKAKNFFGYTIAALFLLLGVMTADAQPVVHPKAYYDAITYTWTGADGVTHENAITEEATDPYQIVALLKKIYCDPRLPGPHQSAYDKDGARERDVYYGPVAGGWDISADDVITPYEDGYTLLMVAVNDNLNLYGGDTEQQTGTTGWLFPRPTYDTFASNFYTNTSDLIGYIRDNVSSVLLLTDGLRIGSGEDAGTAFNVSGTYDRFFMIGKGQAREKDSWVIGVENSYPGYEIIAGERVPFKFMFEQFSPTSGLPDSETENFYSHMVSGDVYSVIHDCASVIEVEHYFSMAGKNEHQPHSLTGLNIFIPDYRLKYWEDTYTYNSRNYTVDGRTLNPYKDVNGSSFINTNYRSYLCANYGNYNQNVSPRVGIYTINLEASATENADAEKTYNVVLEWASSLDNLSNENVPQNYILYLVLTDEEGNEVHSEIIATQDDSYTYQVPQDEHSYTLTYIVFGQPADGEHDAFVAWSNEASVTIPGWNDFLALKLDHFESDYVANEELNYYRNFLTIENEDIVNALTPARINDGENEFILYRFDVAMPDVLIPVATLTLTANNNVRYEVTYDNQEPLAGYSVPITTEGNLGHFGQDEAIDLSSIMFVDQFNAITSENLHPNRYGYVLMGDEKSSSTVEVPVFKTSSTIDGFYTLDEVMNDVDGQLTASVKNANVKMTLAPNPAVYYYTLERGNDTAPNEAISKLQRRTDGSYLEMLDVLPQYFNTVAEPGIVDRLDNDIIVGTPGDFMAYQPVVWTFGNDRVNQDGENSYGSPIWKTGVGNVNPNVDGYATRDEWADEDGKICRIYYPTISADGFVPDDASVEYEPFMFRVWRLCDDIRGYKWVGDKPENDPTADRSPRALIYENISDDATFEVGGDWSVNPIGFGALKRTTIEFLVRFYYKKVGGERMRADGTVEDTPLYYVVENSVVWNEVPTSVIELKAANEVSTTYVNAQGLTSDKPFDGMNIVITRYSDGSTSTTKVVK